MKIKTLFHNADVVEDFKISNTVEFVIINEYDIYIINYETRLIIRNINGVQNAFKMTDSQKYVNDCLENLSNNESTSVQNTANLL